MTLTEMYQEQNRLEREIQRWQRLRGAMSTDAVNLQVALRDQKIKVPQIQIDAHYTAQRQRGHKY